MTAFVLRRRAEGRETEAFSELEDRTRHIEVDIVQRGQEMQRANDLLRDAQGRLRMAMAAGRMFSWEGNPATRRFRWLSDVAGVVGFSLPEDEDEVFALVHPEDRAPKQEAMQSALARGDGFVIDFRFIHPVSGEVSWFHTQAVVTADFFDGTPRFIGITENITERRHHEEERSRLLTAEQVARAEAEAAGQAKDHFLAVLSHELRTPLTPVMMAIYLLARNPELPESAHSALETIERNVQIEAHFIDDLLDLTKIAHGKLEIVRDPMDLHDAVRHAVEVSAGDLQGKNQPITVALEAAEHQVNGDATLLQQAFWNLLKNASKFTPKGGRDPHRLAQRAGPHRRGDYRHGHRFRRRGGHAHLRLVRAGQPEVTRQFGGLGLGLAISKATVDAHEGTLSARSEGRNQGATFTVALTLAPPQPSDGQASRQAITNPPTRAGRKH